MASTPQKRIRSAWTRRAQFGRAVLRRAINSKTLLASATFAAKANNTIRSTETGASAFVEIEGVATTLNEWLVREGWALNFEPYAKGQFKAAEEDARKEGRGLWRGCFSAPQAQRRGTKKEAKLLGSACTSGMDKEVRDMLFPAHPAMPPGCLIKGKIAARAQVTGHRGIYHMAGCRSYGRTKTPYRWFCSEDEAQAEGFRKAFTCSNAR